MWTWPLIIVVAILIIQLRYKQKDYSHGSYSEKALSKINSKVSPTYLMEAISRPVHFLSIVIIRVCLPLSKANQRKFLDSIQSGVMKKIEKLLEQGLDPNFITEDGSEWCFVHSLPRALWWRCRCSQLFSGCNLLPLADTPLGVCCGRDSHIECILPLISAGAHIDYRGRDGLTPVHRAAIGGNTQALKVSEWWWIPGDPFHFFSWLWSADAPVAGGIPQLSWCQGTHSPLPRINHGWRRECVRGLASLPIWHGNQGLWWLDWVTPGENVADSDHN